MTSGDDSAVQIFLDESGYTGEDLFNRDQPIFTLASLGVDDEGAAGFFEIY